jgi:hypothetical protein
VSRRYTVSCDFDGVINSYATPWVSAEVIPDPPVAGAIDWLNAIVEDFDLVIHTTRGSTEAGRDAVAAWLHEHGYRGPPPVVTSEKRPSLIYIDDRAWRFEGTFPTAEEIHRSRPWHKAKP